MRLSQVVYFRAVFASVIWLPLLIALTARVCLAESPPGVPGWNGDNPLLRVPRLKVRMSSPAIAEIDGDSANGREIALAGADGLVSVVRADGSVLWQQSIPGISTPHTGCAKSSQFVHSSPAVGELLGDGIPYVVVGYGAVAAGCDGGVVVFRGSDGSLLWRFSVKAFERKERFSERFGAVFGAPALADTDGDGRLEIGFTSLNRSIYLLNANGSVRWSYQAGDTAFSSPAFADLDGDGRLELVVGTDISANKAISPPTEDGGLLYAFFTKSVTTRSFGRRTRRISFRNNKAFLWMTPLDQVLQSSPAVADLIPEEPGLEIAIGSGCFFPERSRNKRGNWVKIISGADGRILRTFATSACSTSSPALGDLDGDGELEVVALVDGREHVGGSGRIQAIAWNPRTGAELWSTTPQFKGKSDKLSAYFMSPVIGDIDGNGSLEVVLALNNAIVALAGTDGRALTCNTSLCDVGEIAFAGKGRFSSSPVLGDLNGDGALDLVASRGSDIHAWSLVGMPSFSSSGPGLPYFAPWSAFRGDSRRAGVIAP